MANVKATAPPLHSNGLVNFLMKLMPFKVVREERSGLCCSRVPRKAAVSSIIEFFHFSCPSPILGLLLPIHAPLFHPTPTLHNALGIKLGPAKSSDMLIIRPTLL